MLGLLVALPTCCIEVHDSDGQWVFAILQSFSAITQQKQLPSVGKRLSEVIGGTEEASVAT